MSFKFKSAIVAATLLSLSTSYANTTTYKRVFKDRYAPIHNPSLKGGFYLGAQVGYDSYDVDLAIRNVGSNASTFNLNDKGWAGGLFFGYGHYVDNLLYLGGEIYANPSGTNSGIDQTLESINGAGGTYYGRFTSYATYGIALFPGIKLSDATMAFVHLGYNTTRFKYQENATSIGNNREETNQDGFTYGIGLETVLIHNWSVRGEYTYSDYQSFNNHMSTSSVTKVEPANNQFMMAVLYHFS